jgi:hypothetical protein
MAFDELLFLISNSDTGTRKQLCYFHIKLPELVRRLQAVQWDYLQVFYS